MQTAEDEEAPGRRDLNRSRTRRLIIEAYAELSLERGFNSFTMQDIADRAEISHRTLYRYFENREAILEGLNADIGSRVYGPTWHRFLDRENALRHNYAVFGQYRKPMLVASLMIEAGLLEARGRAERTEHVRRIIESEAPGLDERGRRQLLGVIRAVAGAMAWVRMTSDDVGLSDEEAGAASAWALGVLTRAAAEWEGDLG